jgi:pimeloyl-ACP methyl ester carboxylesterase
LPADITLTGIFHDWGCYIGAMLVNRMNTETPRYFGNVVYLDILPPLHPSLGIPRASMSFSRALIITSYTSLFATCHVIQRYLSHWIAAPLGLIGYSVITIFGLCPIRYIDNKTFLMNRPKEYSLRKIISMQYPYYNLWRGFLFQGPKTFLTKTVGDATLPANVSASTGGTPVLYIYGTNKNTMFHDDQVLDWLLQNKQSVVSVKGAGHWFHRQQEDVCFEAITTFLLGGTTT